MTHHLGRASVTTQDESILGSGSYGRRLPLGEHNDCLRGRQFVDFLVNAAHQNFRIDPSVA